MPLPSGERPIRRPPATPRPAPRAAAPRPTSAPAGRRMLTLPAWQALAAAGVTLASLTLGTYGVLRTPPPHPSASGALLPSPGTLVAPPDAAGAQIEVFFSPKGGARERLLLELGRCRRTLDLCVYNLSNDELGKAIRALKGRGCKIRIYTDRTQAGHDNSEIASLERAGIQITQAGGLKGGVMHDKFAIFDGVLLATGSYNWSDGAEEKNRENLLFLRDAETVGRYREEFEALWAGKK